MKSSSLLKKTIAGGFRITVIVALSACTTIHHETISQTLGPAAQEKFQRDFAECHALAESNRPKISFNDDILVPLSVAFLFTAVGLMVENNARPFWDGRDGYSDDFKHDGKALIGFSLAGVVAASWIVVAGMKSRQGEQDATLRACLYERGSPVP